MKTVIVQNSAIIGEKQKNFDKVDELLASVRSADLIVLPELFATGWLPEIYPQNCENEEDSPTIKYLSNLAKRLNSNVVGGSFVLKTENGLKNTCPIFDRKGDLIAKYEKMHLFSHYSQGEGDFSVCGNHGVIVKTDVGKLGISICYDIRFPELFREYTFSGADILINVAAWPKIRLNNYIPLVQARAIENQIFFIGVTQTGLIKEGEYNSGYSLIVNPFGDIITSLDEKESIAVVNIDLKDEISLREKVPTLKDRKEKYSIELIGE